MTIMKQIINILQLLFTKDRYIEINPLDIQEFNVFVFPGEFERQLMLDYYHSLENSNNKKDLLEGWYILRHAEIFSTELELLDRTIKMINADINDNLLISENRKYYDYYYFFDKKNISNKKVCISARLFNNDPKFGDIYYNMTIKKYNGFFYLWGYDNLR